MSAERDYTDYLRDILDAATKAEGFVQGLTFEAFRADDKTIYAVVRALEILGEAAKHIPDTVRARHPGIPWRDMAGARDKVIHAYFRVDLDVVWKTVTQTVPRVREAVAAILAEMNAPPRHNRD